MCDRRCYEIGGPWITYDPQCPEHGDNPNICGYECHMVGGPWVAENPDCPIHGVNAPKDY